MRPTDDALIADAIVSLGMVLVIALGESDHGTTMGQASTRTNHDAQVNHFDRLSGGLGESV